MNIDWLNTDKIIPIGLKSEECYFEVSVYEKNSNNYVLVSNMIGDNKGTLYELISNVFIQVEKNFQVTDIYQIIDKATFNVLKENQWKNINYNQLEFNDKYQIVKTSFFDFLNSYRKSFD